MEKTFDDRLSLDHSSTKRVLSDGEISDEDNDKIENRQIEGNSGDKIADNIDILDSTWDISPVYLDQLMRGYNHFDASVFSNISCEDAGDNLNEIDIGDVFSPHGAGAPEKHITDRFQMRNNPIIADGDSESDSDSESIEEISLPMSGSILNNLLETKKSSPKTKKGRIIDKEAELEYLIPADLEDRLRDILISENDQLELIGSVIQRVEDTQTMTVEATRVDPILDLGTVVFDRNKSMIGVVDNIFGTMQAPLYLIVCKDQAVWSEFRGGEEVFVAPAVRNAYFTASDIPRDAPNDEGGVENDEFLFSDDEKEQEFHRLRGSGNSKPQSCGKKRQRDQAKHNRMNSQPRQPRPPQMNPFRRVSHNPFGVPDNAFPPPRQHQTWGGVSAPFSVQPPLQTFQTGFYGYPIQQGMGQMQMPQFGYQNNYQNRRPHNPSNRGRYPPSKLP